MCRRRCKRAAAVALLVIGLAPAAPALADTPTGGVSPSSDSGSPPATPVVNPVRTGGISAPPAGSQVPSPGNSPGVPSTPPSAATGAPPAPTGPPANGDIPARYRKLYRAAARAVGVDWRVLAAIGKNESDHGRGTARGITSGLNFARCCSGPMQICKVRSCGYVWQHYAVDGDRNGIKSVYDPSDAVPTAAVIVGGLARLFGQRADLLLAGYNAGPGNVQKYRGVPPFKETQAYVTNGLRYIARLRP